MIPTLDRSILSYGRIIDDTLIKANAAIMYVLDRITRSP